MPAPTPRTPDGLPTVGIVFSQFAAYHVDRCEAAAARLIGRARVRAVEVATHSAVYAWDTSGAVHGAEKLVLFPGRRFEDVSWVRRFRAEWRALYGCRVVLVGLPYNLPDAIVLSWCLRLRGVQVVVMTESKHDDSPRRRLVEMGKALLLRAYSAAMVGGRRQAEYMALLGFGGRPVVPGYDTVSLERIRDQAAHDADPPSWQARPFVFVGRFVAKKNLAVLLRGYAVYVARAGGQPRRLVLLGDGPQRAELEALVAELHIASLIDWPGFLGAEAVARALRGALALCLVSREEQWGLVVNEALACGLPVIASSPVGARDALVRDGENGFVIEPHDSEALAIALARLSDDEGQWMRMSQSSGERAWMGDTERFADAVEVLVGEPAAAARRRIARFERELADT
ncbi:MAG: glycosyltransferase [Croceibacterium sp.]